MTSLWTDRGRVSAGAKEAPVTIGISKASYLCSQMRDKFLAPWWVKFLESMFLLQKSQIFHYFFYKKETKPHIWYSQRMIVRFTWSTLKWKKKKHDPLISYHGQCWSAYLWDFCFQLSAGADAPWFENMNMLILENKVLTKTWVHAEEAEQKDILA